jgi:integrase
MGDFNQDDFIKLRTHWCEDKIGNPTQLKWYRTIKGFLRKRKVKGDWAEFEMDVEGYDSDVNLFALTKEEYDILMSYDFNNEKFSENQRYSIDLFLLACNTGIRIADIRQIRPEPNIYTKNGERWIRYTVGKKKKKMITYPLSKSALKIVDRIDFFNDLSEQNIRDNLVYVFDTIKDEMPESYREVLQHFKMSGSKELHEYKPKFELFTFHSSRKTFATVFIPLLDPLTVAEIGGWKNINVMLNRYASKKHSENLKLYANL